MRDLVLLSNKKQVSIVRVQIGPLGLCDGAPETESIRAEVVPSGPTELPFRGAAWQIPPTHTLFLESRES